MFISPDAAQKTFDKETAEENKKQESSEVSDAINDEVIQPVTPVIKPRSNSNKVKNEINNAAAPKVEVKPVKIETPKSDEAGKLAPIPMAKPF